MSDDVLRLRMASLEWRLVNDEVLALDMESLEYLHLNSTGAGLWRLLATGATRPQLANHLVETYGLSGDEAAADLEAFLESLVLCRLLQP